MNLVRLGHYHIPSGGNGDCRTALVVGVRVDGPTDTLSAIRARANLVVWDHDGDAEKRLDVQQDDPFKGIERGEATFHLSGECPFGR